MIELKINFYFIFCITSILFLSYIYIYIHENKINNKVNFKGSIYKTESLCGGFLSDVLYETSIDTCQIPCNVRCLFKLIHTQRFAYCSRIPEYITFIENRITALHDVIVKQHRMKNRIYKENKIELKKGQSIKLLSETIEVISNEVYQRNQKSKWFLRFIPQPIKSNGYESKLSVHIILFDGGSRYVLKNQLPITVEYLKSIRNESSMFDMLKYHTLHHNSPGNLFPLFYGHRFNFSNEESNFQRIVFEDFRDENFITFSSILCCDINETYAGKNNYSGSDHNLILPSCDSYYRLNEVFRNPRCLGDKQIHQHYFEYYKHAMKYYHLKEQPVFSVTVLKDSHDPDLKSVPRVDLDLSNYLKYLKENGIMDKSVVIITADHGLHYYGYYDHSLPLLFMIFPKSFINNNMIIYKNLLINQNRLVTALDLHKTLLDLSHLGNKEKLDDEMEGISLFIEIPKDRNCHNQNVKYGCSCRVGNSKLDNDSFVNELK